MAFQELAEKLTAYLTSGSQSYGVDDSAFISDCLDTAIALVAIECGTAVDRIPTAVLDRAHVLVGADLYYRRSAPQGVSQFTAIDGSAIRLGKDPMDAARPLLRPFLPGGFA